LTAPFFIPATLAYLIRTNPVSKMPSRHDRHQTRYCHQGYTLIEMMIVVAILGIISAIAIPAYNGYIRQARVSALLGHITIAERIIRSEVARYAAGGKPVDVLGELNGGGRTAVGNYNTAAFTTAGVAQPGQVRLGGLDANNQLQAGTPVVIEAEPVVGTLPEDYPAPLVVTVATE